MKRKIIIGVGILSILFVSLFAWAYIKDRNYQPKQISTKNKYVTIDLSEDLNLAFRDSLDEGIKYSIRENLDRYSQDNWKNILPYYLPTDAEKQAIVDAYWESFVKDWDDYDILELDGAGSERQFRISYKWNEPDIDLLNMQMTNREEELKKTYGNDFKKIYKTVIIELPSMIKMLPKPEDGSKWNEMTFELSNTPKKTNSEDQYHINIKFWNPFYDLTSNLKRLYP